MRRPWTALALVLLGSGVLAAARDEAWQPFAYLAGEWIGEGGGGPGEGTGGSIFRFDLQDRVLVRTNWADYPPTKERPAFSHQDLMVIYREPATGPFRAVCFDNEGHVIRYAIRVSADGQALEFLSDAAASGPRYRMSYRRTGPQSLSLTFAIAPSGQPEAFRTYIEAKAHKKR